MLLKRPSSLVNAKYINHNDIFVYLFGYVLLLEWVRFDQRMGIVNAPNSIMLVTPLGFVLFVTHLW